MAGVQRVAVVTVTEQAGAIAVLFAHKIIARTRAHIVANRIAVAVGARIFAEAQQKLRDGKRVIVVTGVPVATGDPTYLQIYPPS